MRKDKEKVLDEVWTEDRVRSFLNYSPTAGTDADFHVLLKAYQSMRPSDFEIFLRFFLAEERNINAANPDGQTVLEIVGEHRHGTEFAQLLADHGAKSAA
ncbi:MAG: PA4642 family protein [Pseudomonadales bacterium]